MNITELKYIIETAAAGSISAAAKNLYAAQPNISKAIKSLEEEYGIQIFQRSAKGMTPTREGQEFIRQAQHIVQELDALDGQFLHPGKRRVELKIAIPRASYASHAFVRYVNQLKDASELKVHIRECNSLEALDRIVRNQYSMALIRFESQHEEYFQSLIRLKHLESEPLMEFQYRLLTGANSKLVHKDIKGYQDLEGYIELIHGDDRLPTGDYVDAFKLPENANSKKRIHVYERGSQFALLQGLPESYMWVSPMPEELLDRYKLVQRECPWQKRVMKDILVYPENRLFSKEEESFVEELKKERDSVSGHC